jgi:hypothetical protein
MRYPPLSLVSKGERTMKGAKFLIALLVLLVLVGFLVISGYSFWQTLTVKGEVSLGQPLLYLANILAGLVGGIVTYGFGMSPKPTGATDDTVLKRSARGLGALIATGERGKVPAGSVNLIWPTLMF